MKIEKTKKQQHIVRAQVKPIIITDFLAAWKQKQAVDTI